MLSIIVPVKNEPNLDSFLFRIHEVMADIPEQYEIIIVQGDRETKFYQYNLMPHQKTVWTYGDSLERSILNGFSHANGEKIIVMDSDFSHPPELIPKFTKALDEYDMVVGSRFVKGSKFESSFYRKAISWGCIELAKVAGTKLSDPMSGYFGIKKDILKGIRFKPIVWKTALEIELKAKPTIKEIPITFVERTIGESKTTTRVGLKIIKELLLLSMGWK
jgi:dolichol-phosphate mannosyltransferase